MSMLWGMGPMKIQGIFDSNIGGVVEWYSGNIKCPALLFSSNGKQTSKHWMEDQREFASIMNAKLVCFDCGHYIHYYKSSDISKEIAEFINKLER